MGDAIEYLANYQILEIANILFFSITIIVLTVRLVEKILKGIYSRFLFLYNKKRGKENEKESIENIVKKINELSELVKALDSKLDAQQQEIQRNREVNAAVDLTLLRDSILGGMRFFNQNKDEHGNVHISMSDHENMSHLFEQYFKLNGNGSVKRKFENEFSKFIIDD